jgi:hypothetical protein
MNMQGDAQLQSLLLTNDLNHVAQSHVDLQRWKAEQQQKSSTVHHAAIAQPWHIPQPQSKAMMHCYTECRNNHVKEPLLLSGAAAHPALTLVAMQRVMA